MENRGLPFKWRQKGSMQRRALINGGINCKEPFSRVAPSEFDIISSLLVQLPVVWGKNPREHWGIFTGSKCSAAVAAYECIFLTIPSLITNLNQRHFTMVIYVWHDGLLLFIITQPPGEVIGRIWRMCWFAGISQPRFSTFFLLIERNFRLIITM